MDALHQVSGAQQVRLAGAGGATPDVDGRDGTLRAEHDRAARRRFLIRPVPDLDARYRGNRVVVLGGYHETFLQLTSYSRLIVTWHVKGPFIIRTGG